MLQKSAQFIRDIIKGNWSHRSPLTQDEYERMTLSKEGYDKLQKIRGISNVLAKSMNEFFEIEKKFPSITTEIPSSISGKQYAGFKMDVEIKHDPFEDMTK